MKMQTLALLELVMILELVMALAGAGLPVDLTLVSRIPLLPQNRE
jgi:hypothetical protein